MKKKTGLILCLCFILSVVPLAAKAEIKYTIKPQFEDARNFSEGLAAVKKNGKWGFIDKSGKVIIPIQYDDADEYGFHEGLAGVKVGNQYGFIDKAGNMVIPPQFKEIVRGFDEDGLAEVSVTDPNSAYDAFAGLLDIDKFGNRFPSATGDSLAFTRFDEGMRAIKRDGKIGFENDVGKVVVNPQYDKVEYFNNGVATVAVKENDELKWGLVDKAGNEIIKPQHSWPIRFREGLAALSYEGKWGYIDNTGKVVIPMIYDSASDFKDGMAAVDNGEISYIDNTGRVLFTIPREYSFVQGFIGDLISVMKDDKFGLITKSGAVVVPFEYSSFYEINSEYIGCLKAIDGYLKTGVLDYSGHIIVEPQYSSIEPVGNVFQVYDRYKLGYVDKSGKEFIKPEYDSDMKLSDNNHLVRKIGEDLWDAEQVLVDVQKGKLLATYHYAQVINVGEGLFKVWGGKVGLMDANGKMVIPMKSNFEVFDQGFSESLAPINFLRPGTVGFINTSGKTVIPNQFEGTWGFSGGLAAVKKGGKWGFIDKTGRVVIKLQYDSVSYFFEDGLAKVERNHKFGLINEKGIEVIKPLYDSIEFEKDTIMVKKNGKYAVLDRAGNEVVGFQENDFERNYQGHIPYLFSEGMIRIKLNGKYGYASEPIPDKSTEKQLMEAIEAKLIPEALQSNYRNPIFKQDFYKLCIALYEKKLGKSIFEDLVGRNMDTGQSPRHLSRKAKAAWKLGIVESPMDVIYDYDLITREEAAVLLTNTAKALGMKIAVSTSKIDFVISKGIMSADMNNKFNPKGTMSRQEAYTTILKLYNKLK